MNSIKCLLVGYSEGNKAYRFEPSGRKVLIRRDAIFNEERMPPHVVTEVTEESRSEEKSETTINLKHIKKADGSDEQNCDEKSKSNYRNPRLPIPRSPYPRRKRSTDENNEKAATIAESFMAQVEPASLDEALQADDANYWIQAINDEINALEENKTRELVIETKTCT